MSRPSLCRLIGASLIVLWSLPALGQSSLLPSWSIGRDLIGKLVVNSGALGSITFRSEVRGASPSEAEVGGCIPADRIAYDFT
jgi:hypothetical protein